MRFAVVFALTAACATAAPVTLTRSFEALEMPSPVRSQVEPTTVLVLDRSQLGQSAAAPAGIALDAVEQALLGGGWTPIARDSLDDGAWKQAIKRGRTATQRALALARAVKADTVLLIDVSYELGAPLVELFAPHDSCTRVGLVPVEVTGKAELISQRKEVLWSGTLRTDATHLMPEGKHSFVYTYDARKEQLQCQWSFDVADQYLTGRVCQPQIGLGGAASARDACVKGFKIEEKLIAPLVEFNLTHLLSGLVPDGAPAPPPPP